MILSSQSTSAFVAKYGVNGTLLSATQHEANPGDITVDPSGNIIVSGTFVDVATFGQGTNEVSLTSYGSSDVFVAKYNPAGTLL